VRRITARVILVVEDDWRTRHFIGTVLKYSTGAVVMESSSPHDALVLARNLGYRIDLLIFNIGWHVARMSMDLASGIVGTNPSMKVLLMAGRGVPPCDILPDWRFLSIPFPTADFLDCVSQLCFSIDPVQANA
jgi:hypothetical protein